MAGSSQKTSQIRAAPWSLLCLVLRRPSDGRVGARLREGRPRLLWQPPSDVMSNSSVGQFISWLAASDRTMLDGTYDALWEWSVKSPNQFWPSLWQYLQIQG